MKKSKEVCVICGEAGSETLTCKHLYCPSCLSKIISKQFDEQRKSFLEVKCQANKCDVSLTDEQLQKYMSEETRKNYDSVMKTIPTNPQDPKLGFDDFCYVYDDKGLLKHKITGDKFHWVNQIHYDLLGDMIIPYVQQRMVNEFKMKEVFLPVDSPLPNFQKNNIFLSEDALTNPDKLILLIQGSGAVRAGQWARALCMNDSLNTGTIFPYLKQAKENGFAVIVFNPNLNRQPKVDLSNRPSRDQFFIPGKPKPKPFDTIEIPENEDPLKHTTYVWEHFGKHAAAKEIVIIAHSAGGWCTVHLLKSKWQELSPKLKAIAFTDSVHSVPNSLPTEIKNFMKQNAVNWVQSDKPLDKPCASTDGVTTCVSSGHPKHEWTSESARESVFKYLNSKVSKTSSKDEKKEE